jgi:MoaA/NifB/PqqE/SkfB family radical SAM enzyme
LVLLLELKGVHFLLTYRCDLECDHCFVWGSPKGKGTFTLNQVRSVLLEAKKLGTVNYVAIEGGEPFLFYPIMVKTVKEAVNLGFHVEILSNCYWATCSEDATEWLAPIAEAKNVELSLSCDLYHGEKWESEEVKNAAKAAKNLEIKAGIISVKHTNLASSIKEIEGAKVSSWELMYKGRAFTKLTENASKKPWREFTRCPYENPILEPLVLGGPVALVEKFGLPHDEVYADACHLCCAARLMLRDRYPDVLVPDQMYGKFE